MDLDRLLAESDFVTLHVPLLAATRHLISTPQFARMKRSAFLVNTSRGSVVDEAALVEALDSGQMASASLETRAKMATIAAEKAIALFSGQRSPNALNPELVERSKSPS